MTSREFCYWLQGFFELADPITFTPAQVAAMKQHLALVFVHEIDPQAEKTTPKAVLDHIHGPGTPRC